MRCTAAVSEALYHLSPWLERAVAGGCWLHHAQQRQCPHLCAHPRQSTLVDSCTVKNYGWTFIAGLCLMLVAQLPSMSRAELVTLMTTVFLCTYSIIAVVLAGTQGGCREQAPPGDQWRRLCASAMAMRSRLQRLAAPAASRQLQVRSRCLCGATWSASWC